MSIIDILALSPQLIDSIGTRHYSDYILAPVRIWFARGFITTTSHGHGIMRIGIASNLTSS